MKNLISWFARTFNWAFIGESFLDASIYMFSAFVVVMMIMLS